MWSKKDLENATNDELITLLFISEDCRVRKLIEKILKKRKKDK